MELLLQGGCSPARLDAAHCRVMLGMGQKACVGCVGPRSQVPPSNVLGVFQIYGFQSSAMVYTKG